MCLSWIVVVGSLNDKGSDEGAKKRKKERRAASRDCDREEGKTEEERCQSSEEQRRFIGFSLLFLSFLFCEGEDILGGLDFLFAAVRGGERGGAAKKLDEALSLIHHR